MFIEYEKEGFLLQISKKYYVLGVGPFITAKKPNPYQWSLFYPPFFSSSKGKYWYYPKCVDVLSYMELKNFFKNLQHNYLNNKDNLGMYKKLNIDQWIPPNFEAFKTVFRIVQKNIQTNKIQKAVPVFFESIPYTLDNNQLLYFLHRIISCQKGFSYAFWTSKQAVIGCTPEILFHKKGQLVRTMALAGTAQNSMHNLLKDFKEKWEHQLVVHDIQSSLKKLGRLFISKLYIDETNYIRHLRTDIELLLEKNISFDFLCRKLHPTSALGGYPRTSAVQLLHRMQHLCGRRFKFGAPFGVAFGNIAFCVAAIRNIQFIHNKMYIGSGCGLVKTSQLDREWKELYIKRQVIKKILL